MRVNFLKPAVFLDRDGVINEIIYNEDTEQMDSPFTRESFRLIPEADMAIRRLKEAGYYIFVVTNQPAAAKGKTTVENIASVNKYMCELIGEKYIDEVYTCYHFPKRTALTKEDALICDCDCRKPKPGLLLRAREKYAIDWQNSYMVGDSYTDILAGRKAGVRTVFVGNFKCDVCRMLENVKPDILVGDLYGFSEIIRANEVEG